jgi:hypothetical protein
MDTHIEFSERHHAWFVTFTIDVNPIFGVYVDLQTGAVTFQVFR